MLARNLQDVQQRIDAACRRVGRDPAGVKLVAVTKAATVEQIRELISLGQLHLAENRPQQFAQRAAALPDAVRWHFIGHLQRNKIDLVLPRAEVIHSIDSLRLLRSLSAAVAKSSFRPKLLLEINISGEGSKGGFTPSELLQAWDDVQTLAGPHLVGLMTMAPLSSEPSLIRPVFQGLRELRERLQSLSGRELPELSMGMSGDFEIAVEEGATLVRVGSRLFEE
jgi:pyridoxal phosphate enzyme (YggS family)